MTSAVRYKPTGLVLFLSLIVCLAIAYLIWFKRDSLKGLREQVYTLDTDSIDTWQSFGGAWEAHGGIFHNNSDERGAKLMSGNTKWQDYSIQADLKFDGNHGDMGLVMRSSNEEEGVDAYVGYYVGLRTTDGTLVIGRSDYGWSEAMPVSMPGGVNSTAWYRLKMTAVGCNIVASSENLRTGQKAWMNFTERRCVLFGRMGLRSLGTGGTWKNVTVTRATEADYRTQALYAGSPEEPEFPGREADFNHRFRLLPDTNVPNSTVSHGEAVKHIGDLQNLPRTEQTSSTIRGVVTFTGSDTYVEDASGGLVVHAPQGPSLNVGDGVEVTGLAVPTLYSAIMQSAVVRPVSSGTPFPPLSVTPWQAASGAYDARFIEIEGHLRDGLHIENGYRVVDLYEGGEAFRAIFQNDASSISHDLKKNSLVRLRGVCVLDRRYTGGLIPFTVLLRSDDDLEVLAGPPWWTPWHVGLLFSSLLLLASTVQLAYFRIQRWKVRAITQERERLAHDIHDTMAQNFAGIGYQIQGVRTSVLREHPMNRGDIAERLEKAYQLVRRCHLEASRTISILSASSPDVEMNVLEALAENVRKLAGARIQVVREILGEPSPLSLRDSTALVQIGQEAISNAVEHGSPSVITISCHYEARSVNLTISDNGFGFQSGSDAAGFGILGMQRRARELGGVLEISSTPGLGTRVSVKMKLHRSTIVTRSIWYAKSKLRGFRAVTDS